MFFSQSQSVQLSVSVTIPNTQCTSNHCCCIFVRRRTCLHSWSRPCLEQWCQLPLLLEKLYVSNLLTLFLFFTHAVSRKGTLWHLFLVSLRNPKDHICINRNQEKIRGQSCPVIFSCRNLTWNAPVWLKMRMARIGIDSNVIMSGLTFPVWILCLDRNWLKLTLTSHFKYPLGIVQMALKNRFVYELTRDQASFASVKKQH